MKKKEFEEFITEMNKNLYDSLLLPPKLILEESSYFYNVLYDWDMEQEPVKIVYSDRELSIGEDCNIDSKPDKS